MKRKSLYLFVAFALVLSIVACDTFVATAYKTLFTAGQAYDSSMKSVAQLQKDGKITKEQRAEINKVADVYYSSYQGAATALSIYNKTKNANDKSKLTTLISEMIKNYATFVEVINKFSPDTATKLEVK
jgi:hypothetical protein